MLIYERYKMVVRELRTAKIYTRLRCDLFRDSLGLNEAGTRQSWKLNHLCFFFVLGSYSLSTLTSLVPLIFSTSQPGAVWPPDPHPNRANAQNGVTSIITSYNLLLYRLSRLIAQSWKLLTLYIFRTPTQSSFRHPTDKIHETFPLSFVYLKTQLLPIFKIH